MENIFKLHPTIHYIRYSICGISTRSFQSLSNDLTSLFGKYVKKKVKNFGGKWIWINEYTKYHVTITHPRDDNGKTAMLAFPADVDIYSLIEVLKRYHYQSYNSKKSNHKIYSIEIKFDFSMKDKDYNTHNKLSGFFARYIFPKFPKICFFKNIKDKFKFIGDYILGDETRYFYPCGNDDINNMGNPKRSKRGTFCKIYMRGKIKVMNRDKIRKLFEKGKEFNQQTIVEDPKISLNISWLIRFEVSFKKRQLITLLKKHGGYNFNSPYDLPRIMNQIYNTNFSDYFEICTINLEEFEGRLKHLLNKENKLKLNKDKYLEILSNKENTKVDTYHYMKKIARIFEQTYLYGLVKQYKKVRDYEELKWIIKKRLGIDLSTDLTYLN